MDLPAGFRQAYEMVTLQFPYLFFSFLPELELMSNGFRVWSAPLKWLGFLPSTPDLPQRGSFLDHFPREFQEHLSEGEYSTPNLKILRPKTFDKIFAL